MRYFAPCATLWALVWLVWPVRAQHVFAPVVTRNGDTADCPDGAALAQEVARVRKSEEAQALSRYAVTFAREGKAFSATITTDTQGNDVRTITAQGDTCTPLAQATAVTIALLLDGEPEPPAPVVATAPETAPKTVKIPPIAVSLPTHRARPTPARTQGTFGVAAGTLLGVLNDVAPELSSELGMVRGHLRLAAGMMWTLPHSLRFGPGTLREFLLSSTLRTCLAPLVVHTLRFDLCSGLFAGVANVHPRGYTKNRVTTRPWMAIPLGGSLVYLHAPVGFQLSALALVPVRRHDFSVDGLGKAYESWPLALSISLGVLGLWR
jgi:hypothetical protein